MDCGQLATRHWTRPPRTLSRILFLSREQQNPAKYDYTLQGEVARGMINDRPADVLDVDVVESEV